MIAYKLFRVRKDGTLGSLFINRRARIPIGDWIPAGFYPTKGFKPCDAWHALAKPKAPHLSLKGRAWRKVEIENFVEQIRPKHQGSVWYLAKRMKVL